MLNGLGVESPVPSRFIDPEVPQPEEEGEPSSEGDGEGVESTNE